MYLEACFKRYGDFYEKLKNENVKLQELLDKIEPRYAEIIQIDENFPNKNLQECDDVIERIVIGARGYMLTVYENFAVNIYGIGAKIKNDQLNMKKLENEYAAREKQKREEARELRKIIEEKTEKNIESLRRCKFYIDAIEKLTIELAGISSYEYMNNYNHYGLEKISWGSILEDMRNIFSAIIKNEQKLSSTRNNLTGEELNKLKDDFVIFRRKVKRIERIMLNLNREFTMPLLKDYERVNSYKKKNIKEFEKEVRKVLPTYVESFNSIKKMH